MACVVVASSCWLLALKAAAMAATPQAQPTSIPMASVLATRRKRPTGIDGVNMMETSALLIVREVERRDMASAAQGLAAALLLL